MKATASLRERLRAQADDLMRRAKDAARRGDDALARELTMKQLQTRTQAEALK